MLSLWICGSVGWLALELALALVRRGGQGGTNDLLSLARRTSLEPASFGGLRGTV